MNKDVIERSLLEIDGSCRDVNFAEHIPTAGATALLALLAATWNLARATNAKGDPVELADIDALFANGEGMLSTVWSGQASPRHLQAYFCWVKYDEVFCELTFFPEDLDAEAFSLDSFMTLLATWVNAAQSGEYYVRFENGAWRHGVHAHEEGVIFSHKNLALPADRGVN